MHIHACWKKKLDFLLIKQEITQNIKLVTLIVMYSKIMGCKINSITRMLVLSCIFPFQIYYPFLFCSMLSEIGLCGLNQLAPFSQYSGRVWPWKSQLEVTETKRSEVKIFISLVSSHARSCQG